MISRHIELSFPCWGVGMQLCRSCGTGPRETYVPAPGRAPTEAFPRRPWERCNFNCWIPACAGMTGG